LNGMDFGRKTRAIKHILLHFGVGNAVG
jgi:hypothetical protein